MVFLLVMADRARLPTLSNDAQLAIMNMVKQGMSLDDALKKAQDMEKDEVHSFPVSDHQIKKRPAPGPPATPLAAASKSDSSSSLAKDVHRSVRDPLSSDTPRHSRWSRRWCRRATLRRRTPFGTPRRCRASRYRFAPSDARSARRAMRSESCS